MMRSLVLLVIAFALGLLGPNPNISHVGYIPIGVELYETWQAVAAGKNFGRDEREAWRITSKILVSHYIVTSLVAFVILSLVALAVRKRRSAESEDHRRQMNS